MKKILLILLLFSLNSALYPQWIRTNYHGPFSITLMSSYGDTIFLGNENANNYLSTDHGDHWTRLYTLGINIDHMFLYSMWFSGNRILAGTSEGIYLSEDKGQHFTLQNQADRISCFINYQNKLMAGNIAGYGGPRLFVSSDQGMNWAISGSGLPVDAYDIYCLEEYNGMLIAGTDYGVFYTDDVDSGWNELTGISGYPGVYALLKVGNRLYCGTGRGLYYTDEITADLQLCENGMAGDEYITSLAQVNGHLFVGCHWGDGVFLLRNYENNFVRLNSLLNPQVLRLCIDDEFVYAGTYGMEYENEGGVFRHELQPIVTINELNPPVPFRLLGNPVTDMLKVDFDEQVREGILTIFYPDGREIRNCKILNGSGEVSMTGLSEGLYLGQVFCNEKYYPFKFIKI